jgi:hypothetical protein
MIKKIIPGKIKRLKRKGEIKREWEGGQGPLDYSYG